MSLGRSVSLALVGALALTAALVGGPTPASAASTVYMSYLRFPGSDPEHAFHGPDPVFKGAVTGRSPDLADFRGRSVIDVGRSTSLDPGTADFRFGAVLRLTRGSGSWNVMQKGYWSDPGQWKLSIEKTASGLRFSCRVKGSRGSVMAYSPFGVVRAGGDWVRVECRRDATGVSVFVGHVEVGRASGPTGNVSSSASYLIGSKGMDASEPDQFLGVMDYVWVRR